MNIKTKMKSCLIGYLISLSVPCFLQAGEPVTSPGIILRSPFPERNIEAACRNFQPGSSLANFLHSPVVRRAQESAQANLSDACFPVESSVQRTINGKTYTLRAFSGKYVQWEVPDAWLAPGALSATEIRQLVDLTDLLYAHYLELVQGEPAGSGLLSISVNPDDAGTGGVAFVGSKGITLSSGWATAPDFKRDLVLGIPNGIIVHEMGHNFDIYHGYLEYYPDMAHAWTTVVQYYLPYYMRIGDYLGDADDALERWFRKITVPWDAMGASASWSTCVRSGGGCETNGVKANDAWGGIVLRFERLHGASAVRAAFAHLREYVDTNPTPPSTAEEKNDLLIESLAAGADLDVSCEMDTWHWEFSTALRTKLAQTYTGANFACSDGDGDGYTPAERDYDDHDATIHPGAVEVLNGIDDDCDGVADDVLVNEGSDWTEDECAAPIFESPVRVTGRIASVTDRDSLKIEVHGGRYIRAMVWSMQGLTGTFCLGEILNCGGGCGLSTIEANQVNNVSSSVTPGSMGLIALWPTDFAGTRSSFFVPLLNSGDYELIIDTDQPRAPNPVNLETSEELSGKIQVTATIDTSPVDEESPTDVRFWANGIGFIETLPVAKTISFDWMPPEGYCGPDGIRAQLLATDHPISQATSWTPTPTPTPTPTASPTPTPSTLGNISTRVGVGAGDNVLIGGFIITGNAPKKVILRAIGPSLAAFGLDNVLADPVLELHKPDQTVVMNDNWKGTQQAAIEATGLQPTEDLESAIVATLEPGAYTAIVKEKNGGTGVGLVEAYDLDSTVDSKLANISTRGLVQTVDDVMIGGFILVGNDPQQVLVRAIGPELTAFGVTGALQDTTLELHDKDGVTIASNDDWKEAQQADIEATMLAPKDDRESAILMTLTPDSYTAIVRGKNDTTGVALVEVYNVSP